MKYRYDVGDAVVVRQDLKMGCNYFMESGPSRCTYNIVVDEMKEFEGKTVHISGHIDGQYFIEEDNKSYAWTDQMFLTQDKYSAACVCESLL
jgi:hypothetical protein